MKTCKGCGSTLSLDNYYIVKQGKTKPVYGARCKSCSSLKSKERWNKKSIEEKKEYYVNNRDRYSDEERLEIRLKGRYGISPEYFEEMKRKCNDRCEICNTGLTYGSAHKHNARIDHSHSTLKVRGLLCHKCNTILGMCNDHIGILNNAMEYLKKHEN